MNEEIGDHTFRTIDEALVTPHTVGVAHAFTDAGLLLRFFVNDPDGHADFTIVRSVMIDPTAMIELMEQLQKRYEAPDSMP